MMKARYAARAPTLAQLPDTLARAHRKALHGRPGPTYVDLVRAPVECNRCYRTETVFKIRLNQPADHIQGRLNTNAIPRLLRRVNLPKSLAPRSEVNSAVALLRSAQRPLLIIGKG